MSWNIKKFFKKEKPTEKDINDIKLYHHFLNKIIELKKVKNKK